jgi:predicted SprT family Zn-dependent metalloprotease
MSNTASPTVRIANQIKASIDRFCGAWGVEEIRNDIQVEFSTQLTRSLGRTQPLQKVIRLNTELCTTLNDHLDEVVCHELAHIAVVYQHGVSIKPHGEEWQNLVRSVGYEPTVRMYVNSQASPGKLLKSYRHYCPVCHSQRIGRTRITGWRCTECVANGLSGELKIEKIA